MAKTLWTDASTSHIARQPADRGTAYRFNDRDEPPAEANRCFQVKVINHYGDEVLQVYGVAPD